MDFDSSSFYQICKGSAVVFQLKTTNCLQFINQARSTIHNRYVQWIKFVHPTGNHNAFCCIQKTALEYFGEIHVSIFQKVVVKQLDNLQLYQKCI